MILSDLNGSLWCFGSLSGLIVDDGSSINTSTFEESNATGESSMSDVDSATSHELQQPVNLRATDASPCAASSSASTTVPSTAASTRPMTTSSPMPTYDNNWHYRFEIPWMQIPSNTRKLLDKEKRPSPAERREIIRILVAEVLGVCKKPGKRHINEIARKVVNRYPKSFRDEIEGQVVGTGYDSLAKQMISRIDNYRRLQSPPARKRLCVDHSPDNSKRERRDDYGCINHDPELPAGESQVSQRGKQEELLKMFQNKDKNVKKIERLMIETFPSQRRALLSALKETKEILDEWPYLCKETGIKIHFKELTGVQIDETFDQCAAAKFKRILRYFQFIQTEPSSREGSILCQILDGVDEPSAAVLLLLAHFKEQQDKLFVCVDDTAIAMDVDTTKLPWTPCIVVCGRCFLKIYYINIFNVQINNVSGEVLHCKNKHD